MQGGTAISKSAIIVPLATSHASIPVASHLRGTVILSSLKSLAEKGLSDRYWRALPRSYHTSIRDMLATDWATADIAHAHYSACNALALTAGEQVAMGRGVGDKVDRTLAGAVINLAKTAGGTPWTFLGLLDRTYRRMITGGGLAVYRLGPKDASVQIHKVPWLEIPYVQNGYRGMLMGMCERFCLKAYVKAGHEKRDIVDFHLSWV